MSGPDRAMRADARRSRDAIVGAASELFAARGSAVQMEEIAARAGLGLGTVYRHFTDKQGLLTAIVGRRFEAMTEMARAAQESADPGVAFTDLLVGYLVAAAEDVAFRYAILGPERTQWTQLADEKAAFADIASRIIDGAVDAGHVRADFGFADFVLLTRAAMANMNPDDEDWRRMLALAIDGIQGPARPLQVQTSASTSAAGRPGGAKADRSRSKPGAMRRRRGQR